MLPAAADSPGGERVNSRAGGFNPTFQRHVAAYRIANELLPEGELLDLGCGVGHSYSLLAPRTTVGVDNEPTALAGQQRETVLADMRDMPIEDSRFASVLSVHSLEHVPDPERVLSEVARVLTPGGRALLVTPNRLTFGPPDEIIDPYHYVEFDAGELERLCRPSFERVEVWGIAGSARYLELAEREGRTLNRVLRADPLRLRRLLPRALRKRLYDRSLSRLRRRPDPAAEAIDASDFRLVDDGLDRCLDLVAVCDGPVEGQAPSP